MYKGLYDKFKNWFRGGNIWLYSDPHLCDEEMKYIRKNYIGDEEQIKNINSKVGKNDTIIFLGDIGNIEYIKKIRGYKILIMGNHDSGATNYQRVVKEKVIINNKEVEVNRYSEIQELGLDDHFNVIVEDNKLFDEVYEGPVFINNKIVLSHEPINLPYAFNIHGHTHSLPYKYDENHLNVCAEAIDYMPISLISLLKQGVASKIEDIHRITIDNATIKKLNKSKQ